MTTVRKLIIQDLTRDIRRSARALRRTPAFTVGAIVTVALTVGASTAIFSVVHGVLLRQLPYRDADRVFWIWSDQIGRDRGPFNVPDFVDYRNATKTLASFAGFFAFSVNLSDEMSAERVQGIRATGNLFEVLDPKMRLGRGLDVRDEEPGAERVVVLTEPFWLRRFGGDPSIVGRAIRLNGEPHTVAGVVTTGFVMPILDVELVLPFAPDEDPRRNVRNSVNFIIGAGRLADGVTPAQAAAELTAIARQLQARFPVENARKRGVHVFALIDGIAGSFQTALWTVFAAVGGVLLIACANLANLMLARAASRRRDVALQLALGSSRGKVVRLLMVESLLVSLTGGISGIFLAWWGVAGLVALAPAGLPRTGSISVDPAVLIFSLAVSTLAGLLFGVIPALTASNVDVRETLQESGRGTTAGGRRVRGLLVSAEVAIAVVLLMAMTVLAKSFANVQAVAPGFNPDAVLTARLTLPASRFGSREAIVGFQRLLVERMSSLPGVTRTGLISLLPLSGLLSRVPFTVEGRPIDRTQVPVAQYRLVTPGYFEAAGIPLKRGRAFSDFDADRTAPVAIVNETLAARWLDGMDPIGARLLVNDNDVAARPIEIVGIVGDVRQMTLDGEPTFDLYLPYAQLHPSNAGLAAGNMFWIARTAGDPATLATSLAREVRAIDPDVAASQIRPMGQYLSEAIAPRRFSLSLMAAFAISALTLAIAGIYAVVMYSVRQRAREIGIRVALGATRAHVVRLIMGHGVRFIALGLAIGLAAATVVTRLLSTMLFGLSAGDATTLGQVCAIVAAASIAACAVPTVRALKTGAIAIRPE
jgi:predicted permease